MLVNGLFIVSILLATVGLIWWKLTDDGEYW